MQQIRLSNIPVMMRTTAATLLTVIVLLFAMRPAAAQERKTDSLQKVLKSLGNDTSRVNTLIALCWEERIATPETAIQYAEQAVILAKELGFVNGEARARNNIGVVYHLMGTLDKALSQYAVARTLYESAKNQRALAGVLSNMASVFQAKGMYTEALEYYSRSINAAIISEDQQRIAIALGSIGIIYYDRGYYAKALDYYLQSLRIREQLNDRQGMAYALGNIGLIYDAQRNYPKALEYYYKSLKLRQQLDDQQGIATSLINIGMVYYARKQYDEAHDYFLQALRISEACGFKKGLAASLANLGDVTREKKDFKKAGEYFEKALKINQETEDLQGIANALHSMGIVSKEQGNYPQALKHFSESERLARQMDNKEILCNNLYEISHVYALMNDHQRAFTTMESYVAMKDSLYSEESMVKLADMSIKYETDKKEQEITSLSREKELQNLKIERNNILYLMSGALFLLLLGLATALFYGYRHRQKVRRLTLVRESEMALRNSVVETEEKERKRFAKDLHDGLGPLLSAVKIYVNELQDEELSGEEKIAMLKYVNDLIDEAVRDTRTIANNLMPSVIADYGLVSALSSFCEKIRQSKALNITFSSDIKNERFDSTLEIILYRVLLELINNTIKHAHAKNIDIYLSETEGMLEINYKDDGEGFDVNAALNNPQAGMGLKNILNRIASAHGICEFRSEPGKGFMVRIEIDKRIFSNDNHTH